LISSTATLSQRTMPPLPAREGMTDNPHPGHVHQPGSRPWSSTRHPTRPPREAHPPNLILRPKQPAPTGDGVKNLRPLTRAPYRALLDLAAYFDAPQTRRRTRRKRSTTRTRGWPAPPLKGWRAGSPRERRDDLRGRHPMGMGHRTT